MALIKLLQGELTMQQGFEDDEGSWTISNEDTDFVWRPRHRCRVAQRPENDGGK